MKPVGAHTWLETGELRRAGILAAAQKAKYRNTSGWTIMDDPDDRRRILVRYDDLKPAMRAKVDQALGTAGHAAPRMEAMRGLLAVLPEDVAALRAHRLPNGAALPAGAITAYGKACAWLRLLLGTGRAAQKRMGYAATAEWYAQAIACIKADGVELPATYTRLRAKMRQFRAQGPACLVSGRWGNQNHRLIQGEVEDWLVSTYGLPTKPDMQKVHVRYLAEAPAKGWPVLSREGIYTHLHRPEVMRRWYMGRHGEGAWKAKYGHTLKRFGPSFRDALWSMDGTKLNIFYLDRQGMVASMQVYIVADVYSEMVLGWSLAPSENYRMQSDAVKEALRYSQARPMQIQYDRQSGHTSAITQDFLNRLCPLHFPTQAHNAKAKPVEGLIGRIQKEVMRDDWFFTGQNIQAKRLDSKPNMEFILAHKHELPGVEELPRLVAAQFERWNNARHPHQEASRRAVYDSSVNPHAVPIDALDMAELFWHTTRRPVTYRKDGITIEVGELRYTYEVYGSDGRPDEAFREQHTGARFVVRYDLDNMDGFVLLYTLDANGGMRLVATAQTKELVAMAVVDLKPGHRATIDHSLELRRREVAHVKQQLAGANGRSGVDPETLVLRAPHGGLGKDELHQAEERLALAQAGLADGDDDDGSAFNPYEHL